MNTKRILLTGGRAPSTLELARLFSANGHVVHVADSFPHALCKKSNSVQSFHAVRRPKQETKRFIRDLIRIIQKEKIDLLVPTCEEIFYISQHVDSLERHCDVFVDEFDKMLVLHNKFQFMELAKSYGLPTPKTFLLKNEKDWDIHLSLMKKEDACIAKPIFSRFSNELFYLPRDRDKDIVITEKKQWVFQEFIKGDLYCTYSVARKGEILAHSAYKSEFRAGKGACLHFELADEKEIDDWVQTFIQRSSFHGQIAFDFIKNDKGDIYPIECNPRLTSGVHLFRDTPFPSVFLNESAERVKPNSSLPLSLKLPMLLYAKDNIKEHGWKRFYQTYKKSTDVLFDVKDMKPSFHQLYSYFRLWTLSKRRKMEFLESTTYDISWDGDTE